MNYCANCGQKVNIDQKFCVHCGSPINIEAIESREPVTNLMKRLKRFTAWWNSRNRWVRYAIVLFLVFCAIAYITPSRNSNNILHQPTAKQLAIIKADRCIKSESFKYYGKSVNALRDKLGTPSKIDKTPGEENSAMWMYDSDEYREAYLVRDEVVRCSMYVITNVSETDAITIKTFIDEVLKDNNWSLVSTKDGIWIYEKSPLRFMLMHIPNDQGSYNVTLQTL
jgi:hypothetical protein